LLVIRFARTGKKHQAYFRIVVADKRKSVSAKFVEILGNYDPHAKKLTIDKDKLASYMKNGAVPSNTVAKLLKTEKIDMPKWVKITQKNKASKKKEEKAPVKEAPKAPEVEEAKAEAEVAPAEEKKESETPEEGTEDKKENNPADEEVTPAEGAKEGE
jgi:small subunit ribosomal protein S16